MTRVYIAAAMLLMFALPCAAQEPPTETNLTLGGPEGGYARKLMPMGNTVNDNIDLFFKDRDTYDNSDPFPIVFRIIYPSGNMGPRITLVDDVNPTEWLVAWHPAAKRYLLVYIKDGKVYAMSVRPNGTHLKARYVCDYLDNWMALTWARKKRFVLLLKRKGDIVGQVLKRQGKKVGSETTVVDTTTDKVTVGSASTQKDGIAVLYYGLQRGSGGTSLRMLRMDHKLNIVDDQQVVRRITRQDQFFGMADPFSETHVVTWGRDGAVTFCTFDYDATLKTTVHAYHTNRLWLRGIRYDRPARNYALWYSTWEIDNEKFLEIDYHYFLRLSPAGTVIDFKEPVKTVSVNNEVDATGLGIARNGNILVCWSHEDFGGGERGTYGTLIH